LRIERLWAGACPGRNPAYCYPRRCSVVKRLRLVALVLMAAAALAGSAQATIITPDSFGGPFCLSSAFGSATCGITTEYAAGGLVFDGAVAVFNDPPDAWGGINGTNVVDLISPVGGYFVMPSSSIFATTGFLSVEIGNAAVGSLLLSVFDVNGSLLGSSLNDDGRLSRCLECTPSSFRAPTPGA
jgi:hypothetical protein